MAVGPFLSHDSGYLSLFNGTSDWITSDHYAALMVSGNGTQNQGTELLWSDISAEVLTVAGDYDHQVLTGEAVTDDGVVIMFDCGKITFTAAGDITARYLYILEGTAAAPVAGDEIIGHIDLDGAADVSSVGAEFSFDPAVSGLFYISRTAAP